MGTATGYRLGKLGSDAAISWWEDGRRRRFRLGKGLDKSQATAEFRRFVKEREFNLARLAPQPTVGELFLLYVKDREIDGKSVRKQMGSWAALAHIFQHLRPADITKDTVLAFGKWRREAGRAQGTIYTDLGVLRAAIGWAMKGGHIDSKPFIALPRKPLPKNRHLTRDEFDRFLAELRSAHMSLFALLAIGTAGRSSALLELEWTKVDFVRRQIDLRTTEASAANKLRAVVPMNDTLYVALKEAHKGATTPWVVEYKGDRVRSVKKAFKRAARRCGWEDVSAHILRHTAAVWMAEADVPMTVIAQYLGHSNSAITEKVYARYSPGYLRGAASALEVQKRGEAQGSPNLAGAPNPA